MQEAIPFRTYYPGGTTPTANGGGGERRVPASGLATNSTSGQVMVLDNNDVQNYVHKIVSENSIVVVGKRGCCMCHVVKRLLIGLGVNPTVYEVDEKEEAPVIKELLRINYGGGDDDDIKNNNNEGKEENLGQLIVQFPVVFVGGKFFGGLERVIATHISGELVPILKDAGALWL